MACVVYFTSNPPPYFRLVSSQIMAFNPSCCGSTAPEGNDIVIHHRNYRAELSVEQYNKLHFKVRHIICTSVYTQKTLSSSYVSSFCITVLFVPYSLRKASQVRMDV